MQIQSGIQVSPTGQVNVKFSQEGIVIILSVLFFGLLFLAGVFRSIADLERINNLCIESDKLVNQYALERAERAKEKK